MSTWRGGPEIATVDALMTDRLFLFHYGTLLTRRGLSLAKSAAFSEALLRSILRFPGIRPILHGKALSKSCRFYKSLGKGFIRMGSFGWHISLFPSDSCMDGQLGVLFYLAGSRRVSIIDIFLKTAWLKTLANRQVYYTNRGGDGIPGRQGHDRGDQQCKRYI